MAEMDIDILARTIWGEARGEGIRGMEAVASVIMNRVFHRRRWPNTVQGVAKQRAQFSAWNKNDPNRPRMLAVTDDDLQFRQAIEIAQRAVAGILPDQTNGADHFHATSIATPRWARGSKPVARIGRHIFYRLA